MGKNNKVSLLSYTCFKTGFAWFILILGLALYAWGYFGFKESSIWKEIIIKFGDVFVIGVIIGYLSNQAQFLGIFKQELQNIIYGKEFIKQQKDIYPQWEIISKEMFKNKFPVIHKVFLKVISDYFPKDEVSFYNDYERNTMIEWLNKDEGTIKVTDHISFDLIAENTGEFNYPFRNWTNVDSQQQYTNNITQFSVNGKDIAIDEGQTTKKDKEICQEHNVILKGCTKYEIKYTRIKTYNINEDYYIGFKSNYIVNKLRVCLEFPDGIDATFICRGTQNEFCDISTNSTKRIEKLYKGIILPRQGYIFSLRNIN